MGIRFVHRAVLGWQLTLKKCCINDQSFCSHGLLSPVSPIACGTLFCLLSSFVHLNIPTI